MPVAFQRGSIGEVSVMVRRPAILGLAALLAAAGCNAGNPGLKREPPPLAKETLSKTRVVTLINKNSATIQSLRANPSIVVKGDGSSGHLSGLMAMDRPQDFRLDMRVHGRRMADIGSNDQGFWFWVKDNPDNAIYTCDHDRADANPLSVTMQPDWIMEAMGLREITDREAATMSASKGDKPGQLVLTQLRSDPKGGTLTKVTVVDESTGEILEHRLYSGAKEKLLARATISQTQHIQMEPTELDPKGSIVHFPAKMQLEWVAEKFSLEITMGKPTINPTFAAAQRADLFTEPKIAGVVRTDLAKLGTQQPASANSSRIYESAPRSGIRLGKPEAEPFGSEGASLAPGAPVPFAANAPSLPELPAEYVGPQVPTAPGSENAPALAGQPLGRGTFRQ